LLAIIYNQRKPLGVCRIEKIDTKRLIMRDQDFESPSPARFITSKRPKKRVRIIKKAPVESGVWKFISLEKIGDRSFWDKRPGYYFIEWWEGKNA
jgi:hypothetical protein